MRTSCSFDGHRPPLCCCSLCLTRVARLSILTAPAQRLSREAARLVVRLTPVCRPPPDQPVRLSSALPAGSPIPGRRRPPIMTGRSVGGPQWDRHVITRDRRRHGRVITMARASKSVTVLGLAVMLRLWRNWVRLNWLPVVVWHKIYSVIKQTEPESPLHIFRYLQHICSSMNAFWYKHLRLIILISSRT